jgi:hypothetical protein
MELLENGPAERGRAPLRHPGSSSLLRAIGLAVIASVATGVAVHRHDVTAAAAARRLAALDDVRLALVSADGAGGWSSTSGGEVVLAPPLAVQNFSARDIDIGVPSVEGDGVSVEQPANAVGTVTANQIVPVPIRLQVQCPSAARSARPARLVLPVRSAAGRRHVVRLALDERQTSLHERLRQLCGLLAPEEALSLVDPPGITRDGSVISLTFTNQSAASVTVARLRLDARGLMLAAPVPHVTVPAGGTATRPIPVRIVCTDDLPDLTTLHFTVLVTGAYGPPTSTELAAGDATSTAPLRAAYRKKCR